MRKRVPENVETAIPAEIGVLLSQRQRFISSSELGQTEPMTRKTKAPVHAGKPLAEIDPGSKIVAVDQDHVIFAQGDAANALFSIRRGKVKLTVVSNSGKEAVIAVLGAGDFFGEGCLAGQQLRMATATAMTECSIMRTERPAAIESLQKDPAFSKVLLSYMLTRSIRIEEDLVDQLFNSSEKRLARALLLLANFGKEGKPEAVIPKVSQEVLAEMIGTTRSRVNFFMNKFRRLGFIEYNGTLEVHSSLVSVVLHD
jgi:CRP/FNR family cyclic AMP-dependent transcriptional regulator